MMEQITPPDGTWGDFSQVTASSSLLSTSPDGEIEGFPNEIERLGPRQAHHVMTTNLQCPGGEFQWREQSKGDKIVQRQRVVGIC